MSEKPELLPKCGLCGEPMPEGEEMFQYHGYSGPCPKPPMKKETPWKCEKCGRADCSSRDGSGLCGSGEFFDPENPPLKCQVVSVAPQAQVAGKVWGPEDQVGFILMGERVEVLDGGAWKVSFKHLRTELQEELQARGKPHGLGE